MEQNNSLIYRALFLLVILIVVNIMVIDYFLIQDYRENQKNLRTDIENQTSSSIVTQAPQELPDASLCPIGCINLIKESTASFELTPLGKKQVADQKLYSQAQEIYVPIGSGSTSSDTWQDINGLQVYIDTAKYNNLQSAIFEASVSVPSKNQWVDIRLYNVTEDHPVWFSEVRFPGGSDPKLLRSNPIVLGNGNKLYKVQMKTQLKYPAYLDQSRIYIVLK